MSDLIGKLAAARDAVEQGIPFEDEARCWIGDGDGGYAHAYTFLEAVDEARSLTGDEERLHPFLVITNAADQVLAVAFDGRLFLPAELYPRGEQ